ncbi:P-loop containing nucleoside triphosphate hydrolase protein [Westerdykella ornata]|uniref:RNA helicase n=1 Tax=Westerdykella ornata TaxID=318751 RepID=A0A6A6JCM7_WESOR|nr:P-loop containing nucleoside triphosphate hydrolase protein [Westerdykella ornata]KAF2273933.1 P-loop containing nucleoside triphosphate hydrolase protein [Westerdykella ornata]
MPPKDRNVDIAELRLRSRQDYLAKREAEQLALLRRQVAEEAEEERTNPRLTKAELREFSRNRETLRLAEERASIDDGKTGYILPDADYSNKHEVLTRKHKEEYVSEVQQWENEQTAKVKSQIKRPERVNDDHYEFVFDEASAIKWVTDGVNRVDPQKLQLQQMLDAAERKAKTIEETRKSLPMYQYREEILAAIAEHQFLVVVAETGSGKTTQLPQYLYEVGRLGVDKKLAFTTIFQIHLSQPRGDILVFLTGQDEIEMCEMQLQDTSRKLRGKGGELIICPIYANLPTDLQAKAFMETPPGARKVVLATNIAETSITIDGIAYVIDPGYVKENVYNARTGMESLVITPCSRASANQRAGRAGRTGPGKAFRLYTKHAFYSELEANTTPEIQRVNLNSTVLLLKSLGINDLINFDFMDPPSTDTLIKNLENLYALAALDERGSLTKIGRQMAEFPADPSLSKAILAANKYGCVEEVLSIVSLISESASLWFRPKDKRVHADAARNRFIDKEGDHLTYLKVWNEWVDNDYSPQWAQSNFLQQRSLQRARDVRDQLVKLCERVEVEISSAPNDHVKIRKAILSGYFQNAARLNRDGQSYTTLGNARMSVYLHPSSVLRESRPKLVCFHELVLTSKEYMRNAMPIEPEWLEEVAPHMYKKEDIEKLGVGRKMPKGHTRAA